MIKNGIAILLVEDDPADAELTIHTLSSCNLANRIELARNGNEALDLLFRRGLHTQRDLETIPGLILLDLDLPGMDGMEVLRQIKNDPRTKKTPIVVLTNSREQTDIIRSSELGISGYIIKPVNFEQFHYTVNRFEMSWMLIDAPLQKADHFNHHDEESN
jgi:two-component system, response regulator